MSTSSRAASAVAFVSLVGGAAEVQAQALPTGQQFNSEYKFVEPPKEVKKVEWKASASAGFTLAAGNSNVLTLSGGASASRNDGRNLVALDLNGVYALTTVPVLIDRDSAGGLCPAGSMMNGCDGVVSRGEEIGSQSKTTAGFLLFKGRYDRFFTPNNAGFLAAYAGLDIPASKKAIVGGQVGYSRQLVKTKLHEIKAELGTDFAYNDYIVSEMTAMTNSSIFLASVRMFVGYNLSLGENTQFTAKAESLINLNPATIVERWAATADATRVNASLALTTKIWDKLSFRFAFGLRYDNCPAPNPNLKFAAYSATGQELLGIIKDSPIRTSCTQQESKLESADAYASKVDALSDLAIYRAKYNQRLDLLTEANLVFNFL